MIRGWETTEFYTTCAMHLITLLTLFGVIHLSGDQQQAILDAVTFAGSTVVQAIYTHSRQVIKTQPTPLVPVMSATFPANEAGPAPSSAT